MNVSHVIRDEVLLATARTQAALDVLRNIEGPKEDWGPWMRDHLQAELQRIPKPSADHPHPILLGSLKAMLTRHFRGGMTMDTLLFDQVHAGDPAITRGVYVEIEAGALPEATGDDLWWLILPHSVGWRVNPTVSPEENVGSQSLPHRSSKLMLKIRRPSANALKKLETEPQGASESRNQGPGKRAATHAAVSPTKKRKKKNFKSKQVVETDEEEEDRVTPSRLPSVRGKEKEIVREGSEETHSSASSAPKVCDACKTRGSDCIWGSGADGQKRACRPCVAAKTRCKVEGLPYIRRPRGKAARSPRVTVEPVASNELNERVEDLSQRVVELEKLVAAGESRRQELTSQIDVMENELRRLKAKVNGSKA